MTAVNLPLPGLPDRCGSCGAQPEDWPLTVYGSLLQVSCPECWTTVAPVRAVPGA